MKDEKKSTLRIIGMLIGDFLSVSILLIFSMATIVFFPLMYAAAVAHFEKPVEDRSMLDVFKYIKDNWKILWKFDLFATALLAPAIFNAVYLKYHLTPGLYPVYIIGYVLLVFDLILLGYGPIIMNKMNVTFKQLLVNCFLLVYGSLLYSLVLLGALLVYAYVSIRFTYFTLFGMYLVAIANYYLSLENYKDILRKTSQKGGKENENE